MNTGAELVQYFCANTIKNIQWRLNTFNPLSALIHGVKEIQFSI